jgi:hypothetical protein
MSIYSTSRAGIAKRNWGRHFQGISQAPASFGGDFAGLDVSYPSPTLSDTRAPFEEPDKRVFLIEPAAVPSRPDYDVFGAPEAAPTQSSGVFLVAAIAGIVSMVVGSYSVGFQHGLHHKKRLA